MKKLFVSLLAIAGLVACTNDEVVNVQQGNPIAFDTFVENTTRVGYDDSNPLTEFDVWAFIENAEEERSTILADENVVKQTNGTWSYGNTQYWVPGNTYYFAAVAPKDIDNWAYNLNDLYNDEDNTITFTNIDGTDDLIYAATSVSTVGKDVGEPMDDVKFQFNHLLSKVKFSFTNTFDNANYSIEVRGIKMNVPETGTVNLAAVKWDLGTNSRDLDFGETGKIAKDGSANSAELLTIPAGEGQVYNVSFDVYLFVGNGADKVLAKTYEKRSTISGIEFEAGKAYNFAANINAESLKLSEVIFDASVNGWDNAATVQLIDTAAELRDAFGNENVNHIILDGNIDLSDLLSTLSTRAGENAGLVIPAGRTLTLDLNGCTISQSKAQTGAYAMIDNKGTLIIEDNSLLKEGKIVYGDTGNGGNYVSNTISNSGELTINSGTIENNSSDAVASNGYPHPIDNSGKLTINGGTFTNSANYSSMRIWCTTDDNTIVTINGGTFNGSIDFQTPNASANKGTLTINGGTFNPDTFTNHSVRLLGHGADVDEMNGYIKGGHFTGKIGLRNFTSNEFNSQVFYITGGTFTVDPSEFVDSDYNVVVNNGVYSLARKADVAKIGEVGYTSLIKAVAAVEDGGTITLVANEKFTETNRSDNSGWWDGIAYSGDKSFTIDLGGKTVSQDGSLNDYLIWIKNDGSKANTITLKNGTLDAGKTAYCAFATASSNKQKITINLENVNLVGNNSNGAVAKIRGGAELNVKTGTVITGKNNYVGIECVNSTTNIYEGAKIYQKGTSSSWGCLVGVSGNGVVNVYGGNGTSARGGFIAMTSGGTINVYGGEWIANTDGTYANDNKSVLIAQSDKKYNAGAGNSVINVTGGTFKGGYNCYGNAVGDAQINIKGGNFNAAPSSYLAEGCEATEANGVWTVRVLPVAQIGSVEYTSFEDAIAAAKAGDTITLLRDITLAEELEIPAGITLNGNGKQINGSIYAGGDLTFAGHTKVTAFSASYYDRVITIGEGACLEVTGGRVTLAYGNTFNITGSIDDAKTADKDSIQPSLIIPAGISITGGNDAAMNVTNAYVQIGSTTSKNSAANGEFTLNFTNSIAEFTNQLTFAEPTSGKNPTFNVNIKDSVLTTGTKLIFGAPGCKTVIDNSKVTMKTYFRNSGKLEVKNDSEFTGSTIQFGENGGNDGETIVDKSSFTITATSTGHALDGRNTGSITAKNDATVSVDYYTNMTITVDETSTFIGTKVE